MVLTVNVLLFVSHAANTSIKSFVTTDMKQVKDIDCVAPDDMVIGAQKVLLIVPFLKIEKVINVVLPLKVNPKLAVIEMAIGFKPV